MVRSVSSVKNQASIIGGGLRELDGAVRNLANYGIKLPSSSPGDSKFYDRQIESARERVRSLAKQHGVSEVNSLIEEADTLRESGRQKFNANPGAYRRREAIEESMGQLYPVIDERLEGKPRAFVDALKDLRIYGISFGSAHDEYCARQLSLIAVRIRKLGADLGIANRDVEQAIDDALKARLLEKAKYLAGIEVNARPRRPASASHLVYFNS